MHEKNKSYLNFPKKIRQYHSKNGITELLKESIPFLSRQIINRQKVGAGKVAKESDIFYISEESKPESISIAEPNNQRLRREFKSYPREFRYRPGEAYELKDCDLVGPYAVGLYNGKKLINETTGFRIHRDYIGSTIKLNKHIIKSHLKIRPDSSKECVFPLICADPSYYHWMMEYLPKVRYLENYQKETNSKPSILIESNPRDFVVETLRSVGYDSTQYEEWDQQETRVDKLLVTTHRPHIFDYKSPELSNYNPSVRDSRWLRERIRSNLSHPNSDRDSPKKIYISRQAASRGRKVVNQDQMNAILDKYGFVTYSLGQMSFVNQVEAIYNADIIMGPHGAGLLNMIFAENPTIIELFPDSIIKPHFYNLSCMFDFEYSAMVTESEGDNLIVNIPKLDQLLSDVIDETLSN